MSQHDELYEYTKKMVTGWETYVEEKHDAHTAAAFSAAGQRLLDTDMSAAIDAEIKAWTRFAEDIEAAGLRDDRGRYGWSIYKEVQDFIRKRTEEIVSPRPNFAAAFSVRKKIGGVVAVLEQASQLLADIVFIECSDDPKAWKRVAVPPDTRLTRYFGHESVAPVRHSFRVRLDDMYILRVGDEALETPIIALKNFY